jgi:LCP family protein required for cell wall assembly
VTAARGAAAATTTGPAHARSLEGNRTVRALAFVMTAVLAFVGVGGATAAMRLTGNIDAVDTDSLLADLDRPDVVEPEDPNAGQPLNILLMGSDDRSGANGDIVGDGEQGMRSDTTMVMHISADRQRVELVSVPRDSTVDVPACPATNGRSSSPLSRTKFNAAFAQGVETGGDVASGALCALTTVEELTDVRMDGFIVIDFAGFQRMIDALGGVEICIPQDIYSKKAGNLRLSAGVQTLDGPTALQYARARTGEGLGDGSDLGRIGRQQELMAALARTVLSKNLLTDSPALLQFLGAVTGSLTMSDNFASAKGLAGLAYSARNVRPDTIAFMTVPHATDPSNANNVVWTDEADALWEKVRNDRPIIAEEPAPAASAGTPSPSTEEPAPADAAPTTATPEPEPAPSETREAGKEAFTGADVTAVCG